MKQPSLEKFIERLDRQKEKFRDEKLVPYLQHLLSIVQKRITRRKLAFYDGMGVSGFTLDGDTDCRLNDSIFDAIHGRPDRIAARFPELVTILELVYDAEEKLNVDIGDLE